MNLRVDIRLKFYLKVSMIRLLRRTAMRAVRMYTRLMSKMMVESGKIPWK